MKVYQVYTTNMWQDSDSRENIGIASDVETARVFVRSALDDNSSEFKVVIEVCNVDEYEGYSKFEVYDFQDGLEWKSNESDAEIGSLSTVLLATDYYEGTYRVEKALIDVVIDSYMEYMEKNNLEAEIEYMSIDEFLELDTTTIDHVLYHAEMINNEKLRDFYNLLNR